MMGGANRCGAAGRALCHQMTHPQRPDSWPAQRCLPLRRESSSAQRWETEGTVMLEFRGSGRAFTCDGDTPTLCAWARLGPWGLTLPDFLAAKEQGAIRPEADDRSCILIFNLGAPKSARYIDMKPDAPAEVRGPFRPINTVSPEIQLSEILPRHADVADKFSLVRSCYQNRPPVHDAGWQMMQTGLAVRRWSRNAPRGVPSSVTGEAADPTCLHLLCCPKSWGEVAAIYPTDRPVDSWVRPTIHSP